MMNKTVTTNEVMEAIAKVELVQSMMKTANSVEKLALYNEWKKLDAEREALMKQYHKEMRA